MEPVLDTEEQLVATNTDISWITILLVIAGALAIRFISRFIIYRVVDKAMKSHKYTSKKERLQRRDTLVAVFKSLATVLIIIISSVVVLSELGVNLPALVAGFAGLGVVLGIAGQSVIKDFLRGMSMLFYDQVRVGDIVEIAGKTGIVESLSLQLTRLRDLDGNVHIVPNGEIVVVTNMSHNYANAHMDIAVALDSDIDKVEETINQVGLNMSKDEKWAELIREPIAFVRVNNFGESSIDVKVLGKTEPGEQWGILGEYRRRVKKAFDKNGIELAQPHRIVQQLEPKSPKPSK